ncbi:polysaccharide lyase family 7 protein [Shewanella gaetbuli]|uniref:Polysaccharide lyase family 7 protein n=1 Tax=Shewanella gaetbuli TaxID=220752 RepID=A0A9X2CG15_9GAMM|nr:polysaccharide lyase family 7 protein [Shewanella gaetbuli]MCL1141933.1 polysaccharide lyase family 7 protein [Shewanella gaetbuli]
MIVKLPLLFAAMLSTSAIADITIYEPNPDYGVPNESPQFSAILSQSKLQISDPQAGKGNQIQVAEDSDFSQVVNRYFHINKDNQALVFKMSGDHRRNEIRVHKNFRTDLPNTFYRLSTEFMPIEPEASMAHSDISQNEITYLQVHNKGTNDAGDNNIPHPLLRVVWKQEANGVKGHYWAIIKANALICKGERGKANINNPECKAENAYKHYDLGQYVAGKPLNIDIVTGNSKLAIWVDDKQAVNHDISYWQPFLSYYKAGVYNQFSHGESHAEFSKLTFTKEVK